MAQVFKTLTICEKSALLNPILFCNAIVFRIPFIDIKETLSVSCKFAFIIFEAGDLSEKDVKIDFFNFGCYDRHFCVQYRLTAHFISFQFRNHVFEKLRSFHV